MLTGYIRGQELRISTPEIAADSIKYLEAEFHFAGREWDGYVKTAYFINGASKFAMVLADDRITADMGLNLTAGEWEVKLSGVKGDSRITTTTEHVYVREFGGTEGTLPDVTPTQAEQLLAKIGDMAALETEAKDSLVAAINEAAKSGGGSGGGKDGAGIESITYKGEDESGGNVYTVLLTDGTSYDITAPKGAKGDKGDAGGKGDAGKAATIQVGNVTTGAAGTPASVSNVGTDESAIFDFTIPRGDKGADGADGADGKTAYAYAVEGGYTGTETEFAAKLAEEMPTTLPNPNALTFTGAVTGSYDGSAAMSVEIPSGGSVGSSEEKTWRLIKTIEITEEVTSISINLDEDGNPFEVESLLIYAGLNVKSSGNSQFLVDLNGSISDITSPNSFLGTSAKSIYWKTDWAGLRVVVMGSSTYDFKSVASYASYVRLIDSPQKITSMVIKLQGTIAFTAGKLYIYGR